MLSVIIDSSLQLSVERTKPVFCLSLPPAWVLKEWILPTRPGRLGDPAHTSRGRQGRVGRRGCGLGKRKGAALSTTAHSQTAGKTAIWREGLPGLVSTRRLQDSQTC